MIIVLLIIFIVIIGTLVMPLPNIIADIMSSYKVK